MLLEVDWILWSSWIGYWCGSLPCFGGCITCLRSQRLNSQLLSDWGPLFPALLNWHELNLDPTYFCFLFYGPYSLPFILWYPKTLRFSKGRDNAGCVSLWLACILCASRLSEKNLKVSMDIDTSNIKGKVKTYRCWAFFNGNRTKHLN